MSSLRWSAEQLAEYQRRHSQPIEVPVLAPLAPVKESKLERRFNQQLADNPEIPAARRNYFFLPDRDFEFDYAWPSLKVAVEVQGMAHRIKGKWKRDIEKRALALLAGWEVLEVDGVHIRNGTALVWLKRLLGAR